MINVGDNFYAITIRVSDLQKLQLCKSLYFINQERQGMGSMIHSKDKLNEEDIVESKRREHKKSARKQGSKKVDKDSFGSDRVIVNKQREKQSDALIDEQWKQARRKLHQDKPQQFKVFQEQIEKQFKLKQKECLPISQIVKLRIQFLTVIHIEYSPNTRTYEKDEYRYSISAFSLFKVIHKNRQLTEVFIKGVEIEEFAQFIKLLNTSTIKQSTQEIIRQTQKRKWMSNFNPLKSLTLTLNAHLSFNFVQKEEVASRIHDLQSFIKLFHWISDLKIQIRLGEWKEMQKWGNKLYLLFTHIRKMKKNKIEINGFPCSYYQLNSHIPNSAVPHVRSILFGGLASLTSISQLFFRDIKFSYTITDQDYCIFQEILSTIFDNNQISHLKLHNCVSLPYFPQIKTLQSLDLSIVSFRNSISFVGRLIESNPKLKSVSCRVNEVWRMNERLINQLENLALQNYTNIPLEHVLPQTHSQIKQLYIYDSNHRSMSIDYLSVIFPKLIHLRYLNLGQIDCGHELLSIIPSPHLEELVIQSNKIITDRGLKEIDLMWPKLRSLKLWHCRNISENVWSICLFKGLMELSFDTLLQNRQKILQQLRGRGIKVDYFRY